MRTRPGIAAVQMNRPPARARTSCVATASVEGHHGDDELAIALHQVLATLTDVRGNSSPAELRDRIMLVRWLRGELTAAETLLRGVYGRRDITADPPPPGPGRAR
jgi:hypothetical protein